MMSEALTILTAPELEPVAAAVYEAWEATFGMSREERTAEVEANIARVGLPGAAAECLRWFYLPHQFATEPRAKCLVNPDGVMHYFETGETWKFDDIAPRPRLKDDELGPAWERLQTAYEDFIESLPVIQRLRACGAESPQLDERPLDKYQKIALKNGLARQALGTTVDSLDPQTRRMLQTIDARADMASESLPTQAPGVTPTERVTQLALRAIARQENDLPLSFTTGMMLGVDFAQRGELFPHLDVARAMNDVTQPLHEVAETIVERVLDEVWGNMVPRSPDEYNKYLDRLVKMQAKQMTSEAWLRGAYGTNGAGLRLPKQTFLCVRSTPESTNLSDEYYAEVKSNDTPRFYSKEQDELDRQKNVAEVFMPDIPTGSYFLYDSDDPKLAQQAELFAADGIGDAFVTQPTGKPLALYGFELIGRDVSGRLVYKRERSKPEPYIAVARDQVVNFFRSNKALKFLAKGLPKNDQPFGVNDLVEYLRSRTTYHTPQTDQEETRLLKRAVHPGVLVQNKRLYAQCSGSNNLFKDALRAAGVAAEVVSGYNVQVINGRALVTGEKAHAQVAVSANGNVYHFDATASKEAGPRRRGLMRRVMGYAGRLATVERGGVIIGSQSEDVDELPLLTPDVHIAVPAEVLTTPTAKLRKNLDDMEQTLASAYGVADGQAVYAKLYSEYSAPITNIDDPYFHAISLVARTVPVTLGAPLPKDEEFDEAIKNLKAMQHSAEDVAMSSADLGSVVREAHKHPQSRATRVQRPRADSSFLLQHVSEARKHVEELRRQQTTV